MTNTTLYRRETTMTAQGETIEHNVVNFTDEQMNSRFISDERLLLQLGHVIKVVVHSKLVHEYVRLDARANDIFYMSGK